MARTLVGESGWFLACPVSPIWAIARVPLSNPDAAQELTRLIAAPEVLRLSRQPTGVGPAGAARQRERRPGRRGGGASNAASLNLAASCQPVPVTFSSRTGSCALNVAELL